MNDAMIYGQEPRPSGPFRMGDWSVDPSSGTVTCGQAEGRLEPKVMEVLLQLAGRPGEVLSKNELIDAVWPDSIVGEAALSRCISELRRALGDDAREPRYIETLPKRGYRLLADVRAVPVREPARNVVAPPVRSRRSWQVLLAGTIAAALFAAWWAARQPASVPGNIESLAVLPLRALSDDPEQRFFAEGLTNQLLTQLAPVRTLRVVSGLAARQARDADAALALLEMAAERRSLRLAAILEDPYLRQLRDKTRFKALLAGMALPLGDDR